MKKIASTKIGKIFLFIILNVSVCVFAASIALIVVLFSENIYTSTREYVLENVGYSDIRNISYSYVRDVINSSQMYEKPAILEAQDGLEVIIYKGDMPYTKSRDGVIPSIDESECLTYSFSYFTRGDGGLLYENYSDFAPYANEYNNITVYTAKVYVRSDFKYGRETQLAMDVINYAMNMRYTVYIYLCVSLILSIISFTYLMKGAGVNKTEDGEYIIRKTEKIPYDLLLLCLIILLTAMLVATEEELWHYDLALVVAFTAEGILIFNVFTAMCMSFAARIRHNTLVKNSVVFYVYSLIRKAFKLVWKGFLKICRFNKDILVNLPIIWQVAVGIFAVCVLELFFILFFVRYEVGDVLFLWFLEKLLVIPLLCFAAISFMKLQKYGEALAQGDYSKKPDKSGLFFIFRTHAETIDRISEGMTIAVEEKLKSERMKTELITNVSHDIKTPLTSIINYATLIKNEPKENENTKEYSEVLVHQSEKLKRLLEDLVEASKASTGNLEVIPVPCEVNIFISQAGGEYEEKLSMANLTLVEKNPEDAVTILADSRRMWRVFDNLMNNICKYSQPGTRVYLTLERINDEAVITFRNTSKDELNISSDELMERFVRGDSSRNTEGNGLGLSIARSFVELQNGKFELVVDGDLFKVILRFPCI